VPTLDAVTKGRGVTVIVGRPTVSVVIILTTDNVSRHCTHWRLVWRSPAGPNTEVCAFFSSLETSV